MPLYWDGDVTGPSSATDNAIARFDGTTGKLIQDGANALLDDDGNMRIAGYSRVGNTGSPANTTIGDLTATRLSLGNVAFGSGGRAFRVDYTDTITASGSNAITSVTALLNPTANSDAEYRAIYFQNITGAATGITYTNSSGIQAGYFENRIRSDGLITSTKGVVGRGFVADSSSPSTVQATTVRAFDAVVWNRPSGTSTATLGTAVGYEAGNLANSAGLTATTMLGFRMNNPAANTITTLAGIDIAGLTRASTSNIGIRVAAPSGATNNYAIQLSDTSGGANGGITFGSDTNLYRSAANTLKTDDKMDANSYAVAGTDGASGSFTTVDGKTVTVTNGLITSIV